MEPSLRTRVRARDPDAFGVLDEWIFNGSTLRQIGQRTMADGKVTDTTAVLAEAFVDHPGQTTAASG